MESLPVDAKPLQGNEKGRVDIESRDDVKVEEEKTGLSQASSSSSSSKLVTSSNTSFNVEESKDDPRGNHEASNGEKTGEFR